MSRLNCTIRTGAFNSMKASILPEQTRAIGPGPALIDGCTPSFYLFLQQHVEFSSNEWLSKITIFKEMDINGGGE